MGIVNRLREIIASYDSVERIKEALFDLALDVRQIERERASSQPPNRFAIAIPAESRWDSFKQGYVEQVARTIYYIDGKAYCSKIIAIKLVREADGIGLRDAKDVVDALEANALVAKARF